LELSMATCIQAACDSDCRHNILQIYDMAAGGHTPTD